MQDGRNVLARAGGHGEMTGVCGTWWSLLPAAVFVIAAALAFATGTKVT